MGARFAETFPEDCWNLSAEAYRLHVEALCWSGTHLLDCRIPQGDLRRFARNNGEGAEELVAAGFWRVDGDAYVVVHHAEHQRTRAHVRGQVARRGGGSTPRFPAVPVAVDAAVRQESGLDWIYRYWDSDGVLLYIGIAFDARRRAKDHRRDSPWWRFVARGTAESCPVTDSVTREAELIQGERPVFNVKHSQVPWEVTVDYCARHEAWDLVERYRPLVDSGSEREEPTAAATHSLVQASFDEDPPWLPDDPDYTNAPHDSYR